MNCPLISIIVPVYQVEKYLEKCINSIIAQTYKNLEIILVDDGSTDNCPAICDRFQKEDARIKVIHQQNGGLSHARNAGLEIATGDFIGFVDSDDWIEPNMYEILMSALQDTGAEIAVCNRQTEISDSKYLPANITSCKRKLYSSKEALRLIINGRGNIRNTVWNKLYKRTVLSNISFPEGKIYEDLLWTPLVIGNAKLIVCMDSPLYHYLNRTDSLSHNENLIIQRGLDKVEMFRQRFVFIQDHFPDLKKSAIQKFQNSCCNEFIRISLNQHHFDANGEIRRELHHQFCQSGQFNILDYDYFSTTCARILFRFSPSLFLKTYIIYQKLRDFSKKLSEDSFNWSHRHRNKNADE